MGFRITSLLVVWAAFAVSAGRAQAEMGDVAGWVDESVRANAQAPSLEAWRSSGKTAEDVFARVAALKSRSAWAALCKKLGKLSLEDAALFEDALAAAARRHAEPDCAAGLLDRLKLHWAISSSLFEARRQDALADLGSEGRASALPQLPSVEVKVDASKGPIFIDGGLKKGQIALTFDDGPHPSRTPRLLAILKEAGVRATFFDVGEMARANPLVAREELNQGHSVGSHSWSHPQLTKLDPKTARQNIMKGVAAVEDATGADAPFFRFPYGARNADLTKYVSELGLASFLWNLDSSDWKLRNPNVLFDNVVRQLNAQPQGGIILFHDIHEQTIIVLPHVLDELRKRGFETVVFVPGK